MLTANAYTLPQWLLMFFIYCFMGWIWESCYVSVRTHKWTNRGFMHGPLLPIYGSGAIVMLFTTLPVKNSAILVFFVASLSATVLEFCTGTVMESIFKVRYWDYSRYKLNFRGHICLVASTAWGVAGVLIVFVVNKPVDALVTRIPKNTSELIAFLISVIAACDFGASFREALDVREILMRVSDETERQIKRLEKRVDVMAAVYTDEFERVMERIDEMTEMQKRRLLRYVYANPDGGTRMKHVAEVLSELKKQAEAISTKVKSEISGLSERKEEEE